MCQKMRFTLLMSVIVLSVLSTTYLCSVTGADIIKDITVDVPTPLATLDVLDLSPGAPTVDVPTPSATLDAPDLSTSAPTADVPTPPPTLDAPDLSTSAPTSETTVIDMCTQHPPKCSVDEATWSGEPDAWQRTGKKWQWYPGTPHGPRVIWEWSAPYSGPNPAYSDHREDHYDDFTNTPDGYPVVTGTAPIAIEWERWGSLENDHRLYQYAGIFESLAPHVGESDCESGIYYPVVDHERDYAYSPMAVQRNGVCVEGGYLAAQRTELWGAPYSAERIRKCDDPAKGLPASESPIGNAVCKLSPHVGVVHQRYAWQPGSTLKDRTSVGCEAVVYAWGWPMPEQVDGGQDYEAWFRNGELRFSRWINFSGEIIGTIPAPDDHAWWAPRCERAWSEVSNWLYNGVYKIGFTVYTDSITLPPTEEPDASEDT